MGLDAYAYAMSYIPEKSVDFIVPENIKRELFFQWRKNWNIQKAMAEIYFDKDGQDITFNCAKVMLDEDDLDYLERCIHEFNYENEYPEDRELERERDLDFIQQARNKIRQGFTIFYDSWW